MAGVLAPVDVRKTVAREIRRLQQQQQQQQQQQREQQEQQQLGASSGKVRMGGFLDGCRGGGSGCGL